MRQIQYILFLILIIFLCLIYPCFFINNTIIEGFTTENISINFSLKSLKPTTDPYPVGNFKIYTIALDGNVLANSATSGNTITGNTITGNTSVYPQNTPSSINSSNYNSGNTITGNTMTGNTITGNTVTRNTITGNTSVYPQNTPSSINSSNYNSGNTITTTGHTLSNPDISGNIVTLKNSPKISGMNSFTLSTKSLSTPITFPMNFSDDVKEITNLIIEPAISPKLLEHQADIFPESFSLKVEFENKEFPYKLLNDISNNENAHNEVSIVPDNTGNNMIQSLSIVKSAIGLGVNIVDTNKEKIGYVISTAPPEAYGFTITIKKYSIDRINMTFMHVQPPLDPASFGIPVPPPPLPPSPPPPA